MIRDDRNCTVYIPEFSLQVHACDVDSKGNVENVDIRVNGDLRMCFNTQDPEHCKDAIETLLKIIWKK